MVCSSVRAPSTSASVSSRWIADHTTLKRRLHSIQIARLPSVSRPVREGDAPIPSLSAAYARDLQHTSDRDAVPDHHIIVGRGLAADDRAAHGELVGGR